MIKKMIKTMIKKVSTFLPEEFISKGVQSEYLAPQSRATSFCGSVAYLAPEMIRRDGHSHAIDIYGLGVWKLR